MFAVLVTSLARSS